MKAIILMTQWWYFLALGRTLTPHGSSQRDSLKCFAFMSTCWNLLLCFFWFRINIFSHWIQRSFFPCWSQNNRWTCIEFVFRHSVLLFRRWFYVPDDDASSARRNNSFLEPETSIDTICGKKIFQIYTPTFIGWERCHIPEGIQSDVIQL